MTNYFLGEKYDHYKNPGFEKMISKKNGIVQEIHEFPIEPDDPRIFVLISMPTDTSSLFKEPGENKPTGSGGGITREEAYMSAVGETIERYCSSIIPHKQLISGTFQALNSQYHLIDPQECSLFHEKQYENALFPYSPFTEKAYLNWQWGYNLIQEVPILVPAQFIYLPYPREINEDLIWHSVSTGMATATTIEEAVLRGIYEIIERDAFSIVWFNKLSMPKILYMKNHSLASFYKKYIETPGVKIDLFDISLDFSVPVVLGTLWDEQGGLLVAGACNRDMVQACKKVFIELAQGRIPLKVDQITGKEIDAGKNYSNINDFDSRVELFTNIYMKEKVQWIWKSEEAVIPKENPQTLSINEELNLTLSEFREKNLDVIVADLTSEDVKQFGFHVARTIIPGMTEITSDQNTPRIGSQRIYKVPVKLGHHTREPLVSELNPIPHPFP